jgi:hypothetical protein
VAPHLAHGGGDGWNSSGMIWLPDFQAGAQPVSLPPTPGAGPLPVMIGYKHHYAECKSATVQPSKNRPLLNPNPAAPFWK